MNAIEMFKKLGYLLETYNEYTIKYSKEECDYPTFDFNLETKKIYSRFMSAAHGITLDELKAVIQQAKELGWLEEEKPEIKQETNYEHYKDGIIELYVDDLAISRGKVAECCAISCRECDLADKSGHCIGSYEIINWLKQPYKKTPYKLNQFEFDLLQSYLKGNLNRCKLKDINTLNELKDKGYFKDIDFDLTIHEILENCEVIK